MHTERKHERLARERRAKTDLRRRARCGSGASSTPSRVDERYGIWGGLTQDERRTLRRTA